MKIYPISDLNCKSKYFPPCVCELSVENVRTIIMSKLWSYSQRMVTAADERGLAEIKQQRKHAS